MNCVLPFIRSEYPLVLEWLTFVRDFCQPRQHSLYLLPFKGINLDHGSAIPTAKSAFKEVNLIQDMHGVISDWKTEDQWRDARGPNWMFRQAADHFALIRQGPWLFLEPDCWPVTPDAFDLVEAEYDLVARPSGKIFMGTIINQPTMPEIPRRLNGIAVYPENTPFHGHTLCQMQMYNQTGKEVAFDIAGANEVVPKSHDSKLFQHVHFARGGLEPPVFPLDKHLIRPETAFFHRCKDRSLSRMLLSGLKRKGVEADAAGAVEDADRVQPPISRKPLSGGVEDGDMRKRPTCQTGSSAPTAPDFSKLLEEYEQSGGLTPRKRAPRKMKRKKRTLSPEHRAKLIANIAKAREAKSKCQNPPSSPSEETGT